MSEKLLSDAEIVLLFMGRDESAIAESDRKYRKYLLSAADSILPDMLDREEVLNDTYAAAWNSIPPHSPERLGPYLSKIMRQKAIDSYKRGRRKKRIPQELTESLEELGECLSHEREDAARSEAIGRAVNRFLSDLPETERNIFVCRYYFSDSIKKIAKMTSLSESSIFKKLAAMRAQLRVELKKEDIEV